MIGKVQAPIDILLVEDNPADVDLMREALEESRIASTLHVTRDGIEALHFLHKKEPYANAPRPDLVLLDLNLPKKDGREVLAEVKSDPNLREIPVIVLTSSQSEEDVHKSYHLHANCYINKPMGLIQLFEIVAKIEDFWFKTVKLPSKN